MEIKLDIGKNIHDKLNEFSEIDGKNYESSAKLSELLNQEIA